MIQALELADKHCTTLTVLKPSSGRYGSHCVMPTPAAIAPLRGLLVILIL